MPRKCNRRSCLPATPSAERVNPHGARSPQSPLAARAGVSAWATASAPRNDAPGSPLRNPNPPACTPTHPHQPETPPQPSKPLRTARFAATPAPDPTPDTLQLATAADRTDQARAHTTTTRTPPTTTTRTAHTTTTRTPRERRGDPPPPHDTERAQSTSSARPTARQTFALSLSRSLGPHLDLFQADGGAPLGDHASFACRFSHPPSAAGSPGSFSSRAPAPCWVPPFAPGFAFGGGSRSALCAFPRSRQAAPPHHSRFPVHTADAVGLVGWCRASSC